MSSTPESPPPNRDVLWVSVDGVECSGKTSLCEGLKNVIKESRVLPEFSPSPVGQYLQRSVASSPHFISRSLIGQSLLFLADYAEIAQSVGSVNDSDVRVAFQDRGFLSKFVYQLVVLQDSIGERRAREFLSVVMNELPQPQVTVFLDAPISVIESRLHRARPGWLTVERRIFIERATAVFRQQIGSLDGGVVHLSQGPLETIEDVLSTTLNDLQPYFGSHATGSSGAPD